MFNYVFLIGSVITNVIGQTFIKMGANQLGGFHASNAIEFIKIFLNPWIVVGLATYVVSTGFWIISLSKFDLSFAYPFLSIGYILILIVSYFIFKENITWFKIAGVGLIVFGIFLISIKQ